MRIASLLCFFLPIVLPLAAQDSDAPATALTGSLGWSSQFYRAAGIDARMANPSWNVNASLQLTLLHELQIPLNLTYGHQGGAEAPTFSRFGLSPRYRWITLHAGWRSLHFSSYTLAGHTLQGGGMELRPGKWRLAVVSGVLRKAHIPNNPEWNTLNPVLKRTAEVLKLGYGTPQDFFELTYLRARDRSLEGIQPPGIAPQENAVGGYRTQLQLGEKVRFFSEGAVSAFTADTEATPVDDRYTVYGLHWPKFFQPTVATRLSYAVKGGFDLFFSRFQLQLAYERIMPEYQSMGAYFFNNDFEHFTLAPVISLWKGKLNVQGQAGLQRNNLLDTRTETTFRLAGNTTLTYMPTPGFGAILAFNNLMVRQEAGRLPLNDTLRIANITSNLSFSPYWQWSDTASSKSVNLNVSRQSLHDFNPFSRAYSEMDTWFATANFRHTPLGPGWSYDLGLNYNRLFVPGNLTNRYGITLGFGRAARNGKWQWNNQGTYNLTHISGTPDGSITTINQSLEFTPSANHSFRVFSNLTLTRSVLFDDFAEWIGGLEYTVQL